ncbi:16S rRNA (guanine(966)-N(2))-methyltransferase RsmD [candidate division Kazan bacterium RIFCSPHIGHO2_01_FULL_44_14]|uniref:16S rRNA (Guanine(966)-N(2))-methyltransferase RsmD n=1 Tax=candidate division Kazan bacterium RIFCSPLOWO2_01_FULL_45_19 TaxID=1798538 RepID=A0A1F4NR31_UNCK3|nr:hypothetical protein [uncultured bacterium]OGB73737.1 MAG: 16S rRNA (guanine(966)-N(2))-methyltransferase RsmD [candidate division Kazan bacterium RIFCSPLOWO2_01_FULL_45_19]OGB77982.1 MAG: 16S rRNA (guanine(966)-N(2))-methyltransferase RsmD [candidate division Kazan bacterium RIFCSPHIGHO2_01_FULL_44_14]
MQLRITAGKFKGNLINTLPTLRPAMELVRKAVFDVLNDKVVGANFLELFAGSGAIGIEAISRGATQVLFVEKDRNHYNLIKQNLNKLGMTDRGTVRMMLVEDFLTANQSPYNIVFADPWYEDILDITGWENLLTENGILVIEHSSDKEPPQNPNLRIWNNKRYGDTALTFYTHA